MSEIFLEAESFRKLGGWVVDQQSMETIHSSYIMAHGMGVPVENAATEIHIDNTAKYNVWVLTRDWTSVWDVRESAGKFSLAIDEIELENTLGTNGKDWAWQSAGSATLKSGTHTLSLRDLSGFNGRCDAIYLTESDVVPSSKIADIDDLRKRLNWHEVVCNSHKYDLIVVGGGIAGICTALSAIRSGLDTLLIHDRGVLGGCNSSEVRVCMGGIANLPPFENIGNVVKEIAPIMGLPSTFKEEYYEDNRKLFAFEVSRAADSVLLNSCVTEIEKDGNKITAVVCTDTLTGKKTKFFANMFSDCTGDAVVSRLAGAQTMYGREARSVFGESLAPEKYQKTVMGHSIRWYSEDTGKNADFPDIDWGLKFNDDTCLNVYNGDWEQETGFFRDMIGEIEYIRDFGLRAIFSNWSYQKNHYTNKDNFKNYSLKWVSPIGGKRESYRVVGDYILTQQDIEEHRLHNDATSCITWSIDMHFPEVDNMKEFDEPFRSYAYHRGIVKAYPVPYRCLYSKDIDNLFLGGRIVSASHVAFSAIRVMRTLGQLGEVAGLAASVCKDKKCMPKNVYEKYLDILKDKMKSGVKIPSAFCCDVGNEEAYHFKDIGWLYLGDDSYTGDGKKNEKFKRGIAALGIKHKYKLPKELE